MLARAVDARHEGAVQLQRVEAEVVQVRERRVARAEVVEQKVHAQRLDLREEQRGGAGVLHDHALGDLQPKPVGFEPALLQREAHLLEQLCPQELPGGEVHADRDGRAPRQPVREPARRLARLAQHPFADGADEACLLGRGDELGGWGAPALRVLPFHQRLAARDEPGRERDDGLEGEAQLVAFERPVEVGLQLQLRARMCVHRRMEDRVPRAAQLLGAVHGGVGVAEQLFGPGVTAPGDRDADARRREHLHAAEIVGGGQLGLDPLRAARRILRRAVVLEE